MGQTSSELPVIRRLGEGLVLACPVAAVYYGLGETRLPAPAPLAHALDGQIPFVPAAVWIYIVGYAATFLITLWAVRDARHFRAALTAVAMVTLLAVPFFALFPVAAPRPAAPHDPTVTAALVRWLYAHDPAGNTFPSLHVANATVCAGIATASSRRWGAVVWALALAVSASVLLLKQHWLVDIPGGWALAAAGVAAFHAQLAAPSVLAALPARLLNAERIRPILQRVRINPRISRSLRDRGPDHWP